jgi:cytochrome P450
MFHHRRIAGYGGTMIEATERLAARWRDGQEVDVHTEMMDLTLDIVGRTLFGIRVQDEDARRIRQALADSLRLFGRLTIPFSRVLWALPLPSTRRFLQARAALDDVVYGMIAARRRSGDHGDVLSMLLQARDEHGEAFDDRQVRDEAMTLLLAGHETTANALTWTWYLLSQHPEAERALHEEVDSVIEDRLPTVEDVPRLRYTEMAVAEAMRLYPPSWAMGRRSLEDHEVGGYAMPAGSTALLSQYVVHHDPRWYPDPFRFDPLRFTPQAQAERLRFAYFPFGGGARMCIGESFAWMEAVLVVATLASRWRLRLAPGQPVALQPQVTLRPKHGMRMRLERRR